MTDQSFAAIPASFQQERHWYRRDRRTNGTRRNMAFAARLDAELDHDAFQASVADLTARHDVLRTTLYEDGGEVWQRVHDRPMISCVVVDLCASPEGRARAVADVEERLRGEFDLAHGPLGAITLYRFTESEHLLAIVCNHVIGDGWSFRIALDELGALYRSRVAGRPSTLPPLAGQYGDYARWQREWAAGTEAQEHAEHWKRLLYGRPGKQLPQRTETHGSGIIQIALGAELSDELRAFARSARTTMFVLLLTAYAIELRHRLGDDEVLVAVAVARRQRPHTHPLIGFFAGAVCLRLSLGGATTFTDAVRRVHNASMSALAHEELDLTTYLRMVEPDRDEDADPIACAGFFFEPAVSGLDFAGIELTPVELGRDFVPSQVEAALHDDGRRVAGTLRYSNNVLGDDDAASFAARYRELLAAGSRDQHVSI